ncbi:MAG: hypothetical protein ACUVX8_02805 [Candidatus Zipacnadales bacterium]
MIPVLGGPEEGLVSWIDEGELRAMTLLRGAHESEKNETFEEQLEARLRDIRTRRTASWLSAAVGWLLRLG